MSLLQQEQKKYRERRYRDESGHLEIQGLSLQQQVTKREATEVGEGERLGKGSW